MQIEMGKLWGKYVQIEMGNGGGNANRDGETVGEMQIDVGKR
jgi:hypothetical protein